MIYLDSSVALAAILAEARMPPEALWKEQLSSSRLLQYEVWNRIFAKGLGDTHADEVAEVLRKVDMIELTSRFLGRALRPFPIAVRTLDGLHLATIEYLRADGDTIELASYDGRLIAAAAALGIPLAELS